MRQTRLAIVAALAALGTLAILVPEPADGRPGPPARADTSGIDSLLSQHAHAIRVEQGRLRGPGARLLAEAASGTRFFAMGEAPHLRAATPPFAAALFRLLREEAGYRYLALEEGPYIARLVSEAGARGGPDSVTAVARRYPTAFHMYTVPELRLMGQVAAASGAPAEGPGPIWGVNRVYGAWHVLERLARIALGPRARKVARALADSARPYEEERFARNVRWLVEGLSGGELDRLEDAFTPDGAREARPPEAARLIEQLRVSRRTFAPYHRENARPEAFYRSARLREDNMKRLFARRYREALRAAAEQRPSSQGSTDGAAPDQGTPGAQPRVMAKLGLYHLSRGRKMVGEVYTLGNFLSELAAFEGEGSFHLAVLTRAEEVRRVPLAAPFLEAAPRGEPLLFDFRPLHPLLGTGQLDHVDPAVRRLLLDYDAMAVLPDTGMGQVEPLRTPSFHLTPGG